MNDIFWKLIRVLTFRILKDVVDLLQQVIFQWQKYFVEFTLLGSHKIKLHANLVLFHPISRRSSDNS